MSRRRTLVLLVGSLALGCAVPVDVDGDVDGSGGASSGSGGSSSSGGAPVVSTGGSTSTGGFSSTGGTATTTGGASTGGASTGGAASGGASTGGSSTTPDGCIELSGASFDSGSFGSTEARCYSLASAPPYGWGVYNLNDRTLTVNGQAVSSGAAMPGSAPYVLEFTAGSTDTSWNYW